MVVHKSCDGRDEARRIGDGRGGEEEMRGDREDEIVPKVGGGGYLSSAAVPKLVDLDLIPENGVGLSLPSHVVKGHISFAKRIER